MKLFSSLVVLYSFTCYNFSYFRLFRLLRHFICFDWNFLISFNKKDEESLKIKTAELVALYILTILIISSFTFLNNPAPIFYLSTPVFNIFSQNLCTLEPILSLNNSLYAQKDLKKPQQK